MTLRISAVKSPWSYMFQLCLFEEYFVSIKMKSIKMENFLKENISQCLMAV